jgi:hypothetical protein
MVHLGYQGVFGGGVGLIHEFGHVKA